jgi:hypothetical protein
VQQRQQALQAEQATGRQWLDAHRPRSCWLKNGSVGPAVRPGRPGCRAGRCG